MMKTLPLILLVSLHLCARSQQNASVDVTSYQFNISLSDASDTIDCSAIIALRMLRKEGPAVLDLISRKANGKGMTVYAVSDERTKQPLSFTHANDLLSIRVPSGSASDQLIRISYRGIPADGLIISKNKFNQRTFFSDNWPNRARNWLVCHDHPSDKAPVDFIVIAPAHYQVVSNGVQTEETNIDAQLKLTHWHEAVPLPVKVMGIGVAEFAVSYAGDAGTVPVYTWAYTPDRDNGFHDYAVATQVLSFLSNRIAPYPYRKLANVESKTIFGGMENASAIFYSEKAITGTGKAEGLIAHEVAHQWFGNMATERDWPHLWLSEGFATYFSLLYLENRYGADTLIKELQTNRAAVINFYKQRQRPVVDTTVTNYMELLNPNSYEKGGWVLHMLRKQLGDSIFFKGIRAYYDRFAGGNATTDDLRKVLEEVSGRDLKVFFQQWLYTAGHPQLSIQYFYSNKSLTVTITQQQERLFDFPLTIVVRGTGGDSDLTKAVHVNQKTVSFSVPLENAPREVAIDPFTSLLYERVQ